MSTVVPESLRVVLDTNVLVSAFTHNRSLSFQIWQKAIDRRFRLLLSPQIVTELAGVLRLKFSWGDARILSEMKFLVKTAEIVVPRLTLRVVPEDECAVAGNAGLVVSGDYHLRKLKSYHGIGIVTPIDFRRMLGV
jgi:putative PIN family toxin of toxin-antitoxin system